MTQKFQQLNSHYASVHALISHTLPVTEAEVTQAEQCINSYMQFYWEIFENINITPIQHILESHCIPFLRTWQFGLGLLREQGGGETHALINELKVRVRGVNNEQDKLKVLMREQLTIVSPRLRSVIHLEAKAHPKKLTFMPFLWLYWLCHEWV